MSSDDAFPILSSPDLRRALAFYRELLGAEEEYRFLDEGEPAFVGLRIGGSHLGLAQDDDVDGRAPEASGSRCGSTWTSATRRSKSVRAGGAAVTEEPADQPWGERVARVLDLDGNEIIVGQRAPGA